MGFAISAAIFVPKFTAHSNNLLRDPQSSKAVPWFRPNKIPIRNPRSQKSQFAAFAEGGNSLNGNNGIGDEGGDAKSERRRPPALNLRWRDLLDPDPENIVAIGLAGVLTWASVQVLWQLFYISTAILLAALKYSFIAAILLFILITLL